MKTDADFETHITALLQSAEHAENPLRPALKEMFERYHTQHHLLERLTRISDQFQLAERERGQDYLSRYQRKVRQIEKIVRISDRYQSMLRELNERLHQISTQDELTGLPNRRYLMERLGNEMDLAQRMNETFAIALADIDHFKVVNDTWGHAVGDVVLIHTARLLDENVRHYDVCGRWGGEEFLILFPRCDAKQAVQLAERIRQAQENYPDATISPHPRVTFSIGVTEFRPGENIDMALKRADDALYAAKTQGRNRVVCEC